MLAILIIYIQLGQVTIVGHSRTGAVQSSSTSLYQRLGNSSRCVWYNQYVSANNIYWEFSLSLGSDSSSFDAVDQWIEDIRAERGDDAVIVLTGNKLDLDVRKRKLVAF